MSAVLGMGMMAGCVAELIDECDRVCLMSVCGLDQPLYLCICISVCILPACISPIYIYYPPTIQIVQNKTVNLLSELCSLLHQKLCNCVINMQQVCHVVLKLNKNLNCKILIFTIVHDIPRYRP